jgi:MFS family permease
VAFRVLFNARFYYPVLAVFFVDLGLTLEQYALLNVAWAVSIVALELPLGALGDQIGRKPLVVAAATIMVVEMSVLAFFDAADPAWLFWIFLLNRVLSGAAEAAASGADEALAYDTLVEEGRVEAWPDVLARLGRSMAVAMAAAMVVGGLVYDPDVMRRVFEALGLEAGLDQRTTARFPVYLCVGMSLGAWLTAIRMREPTVGRPGPARVSLRENVKGILASAVWVARSPFVLTIVLFFLVLDSVVRVFLTVTSTYFRMLDIEPRYFGLLSAAFAMLGLIVPSLARRMVRLGPPGGNFTILYVVLLAGLGGLAAFRGAAGIVAMLVLAVGWHLLTFFVSHYLNGATESSRRATVLSIKSLAGNLAYGAAGAIFAAGLRGLAGGEMPAPGSAAEERAFASALRGLACAFLGVAPLLVWSARVRSMRAWPGDDGRSPASPPPARGPGGGSATPRGTGTDCRDSVRSTRSCGR